MLAIQQLPLEEQQQIMAQEAVNMQNMQQQMFEDGVPKDFAPVIDPRLLEPQQPQQQAELVIRQRRGSEARRQDKLWRARYRLLEAEFCDESIIDHLWKARDLQEEQSEIVPYRVLHASEMA